MEVTATLSQYRQAPRKVRLVGNLVKGRSVEQALVELSHRSRRAAPVFVKLIKSAVANAKARGLDEKSLTIKGIRVDKGPVLKRSMPRAQGRAFPIHKHTSHVVVTLTDTPEVKKAKTKDANAETTKKTATEKKAVAKKPAKAK